MLTNIENITYIFIFSRTFKPTKASETIIKEMFADEYKDYLSLTSSDCLFAALVETATKQSDDNEELNRLRKLLDDYEK